MARQIESKDCLATFKVYDRLDAPIWSVGNCLYIIVENLAEVRTSNLVKIVLPKGCCIRNNELVPSSLDASLNQMTKKLQEQIDEMSELSV